MAIKFYDDDDEVHRGPFKLKLEAIEAEKGCLSKMNGIKEVYEDDFPIVRLYGYSYNPNR